MIKGTLDEELLHEGWIACELLRCSRCEGSGVEESGYPVQGGLPATETVYCDRCDGSGYILDLNTAISCQVKTTVEIT